MQVDRITTPVVQRLVEVFARGRPATKTQPALPAFPSKANHQFRYLRRTLAWGVWHGYCKSNPAQGVRQAKEAREHRMPTPDAFARVLAFARAWRPASTYKGQLPRIHRPSDGTRIQCAPARY